MPKHLISAIRRLLLVGALLLAIGLPNLAGAQEPLPFAHWQYSVGEVLAPLAGKLPEWRVTLGAGAVLQPNFEGAKRYEVEPSAIIDIRYRDLFFVSDGEGIGVNLLRGPGYRAGVAVSYDLGRDTHDDPRLRALSKVSPAPEPTLFAQYFLLPVVLTADLRKGIGGNNGLVGDVGAYVPLPLGGHSYLFLGPSLTMADGHYMKSYFSVSADQASSSGLRPFSAGGGLKSVSLGATAVRRFGDHWLLIGQGAWERLLGDAAASPVPETDNQFVFSLDIGYRF